MRFYAKGFIHSEDRPVGANSLSAADSRVAWGGRGLAMILLFCSLLLAATGESADLPSPPDRPPGRETVITAKPGGVRLENVSLAAVAIALAVSAGLLGRRLGTRPLDRWRLLMLGLFHGRHVVLCGASPEVGVPLACNLLRRKKTVVVIDHEAASADRRLQLANLAKAGAIVLHGPSPLSRLLREARAQHAERIFAAGSSDVANAATALAVQTLPKPPPCHLHIQNPGRAESLTAALSGTVHAGLTAVFSLPQITALHLLEKIFTDARPRSDQGLQVVLIGFGAMGQGLACRIAAQAHFTHHRRVELLICDANIGAKRDAFLARYPRFCPAPGSVTLADWESALGRWSGFHPSIRPVPSACGEGVVTGMGVEYVAVAEFLSMEHGPDTEDFIHELKRRMRPDVRTVMVLCGEDERANADDAFRLHQRLLLTDPLDVYVWLPQSDSLVSLLSAAQKGDADHPWRVRLHAFGHASELLAPDRIVHSRIEELAEHMHRRCRALPGAHGPVAWRDLSEADRRETRDRAASLILKVGALGLACVPAGVVSEEEAVTHFTEEDVRQLEEMEHNRWMAERLLDGWSYAPARDNARRRHNLLVPYALLTRKERDKDTTVAAEILGTMEAVGLRITRRPHACPATTGPSASVQHP